MLKMLMVVLSLGFTQARAINEQSVKILDAQYNSHDKTIEVLVSGCGGEYGLKLRGCTDLFMPYTCVTDIMTNSSNVCDKEVVSMQPIFLEQLGLDDPKFKNSTVIIKGINTEVKVLLRKI